MLFNLAQTNSTLYKENAELRKNLTASLKVIQNSGTELSPEVIEELKAYNAEARNVLSDLKASQGSIRNIIADNKENIKALDYEAMKAAFAEIASIQSTRNSQLAEINQALESIRHIYRDYL